MEEDATLGRIGGFRLIKRLATGGTSDVLLARAEGPHGFERTVVLKRLLTEHQNDPDFARMFTREAAAYARLSHPAIVRLFDFFTASGQLVMVLEYVDGMSLARLMTQAAQANQKLDDRICFFLAARVFDALSAAHDAHNPDTGEPTPVIHRDVNPSNVLLPWDGHAKLADFGIAKIQGSGEAETSQGLIKGTYGYMAPEQVRGERVTIRTDVYAASLVLWELLARRKAIQADKLPEMEILRAMAEPNLPKLDVMRPDVHESVREAVARGLEPNPAKRSMTAEEMMGILRAHFDPEDARQRLEKVLMPLKPDSARSGKQPSLSDTIAEDLRETAQGPAMTLPIATERPRIPPRPPPPRPSTAATAVAVAPAELRTTTPSGFRPVPAQQLQAQTLPIAPPNTPPMRERELSKPTLAGGFAPLAMPPQLSAPPPAPSEAPTLQTKAVDPSQVSFASSGAIPIHHASQSWAPAPPPAFPNHPPPQQHNAMLPIIAQQQPRRSSYGVVIVIAILAGLFVVGAVGGVLLYMRGGATAFSLPTAATATTTTTVETSAATSTATTTTNPTATATVTTSATATTTATATATATTTAMASASATSTSATTPATATATATSTAPTSDTPKPGPDEGVLILPASAQGHRIFIDGKVKGDGSAPILISCGQHAVQIGSAGKSRDVNVPCGALARIEP